MLSGFTLASGWEEFRLVYHVSTWKIDPSNSVLAEGWFLRENSRLRGSVHREGNPRFVVEQKSQEIDHVYVFVVFTKIEIPQLLQCHWKNIWPSQVLPAIG